MCVEQMGRGGVAAERTVATSTSDVCVCVGGCKRRGGAPLTPTWESLRGEGGDTVSCAHSQLVQDMSIRCLQQQTFGWVPPPLHDLGCTNPVRDQHQANADLLQDTCTTGREGVAAPTHSQHAVMAQAVNS